MNRIRILQVDVDPLTGTLHCETANNLGHEHAQQMLAAAAMVWASNHGLVPSEARSILERAARLLADNPDAVVDRSLIVRPA